MKDKTYFKAFIRVVKSLTDYGYFGSDNIISERLIEAKSKDEVKKYMVEKYPQFFQNGKIYTRETKDDAQFFYVVIYPLYEWEKEKIEEGQWTCSYCGQVHENAYVSKPRMYKKLFGDMKFCNNSEDDHCLEQFKKKHYKDIELPDDEFYINESESSPNYIYKITEKATDKSYIGKTKNAPFFRWWNHLTHSSSPFGLYLRETKLSDWTFEVLEELPNNIEETEVFRIESEYMVKYNSIHNGFNKAVSNKSVLVEDKNQLKLKLDLA